MQKPPAECITLFAMSQKGYCAVDEISSKYPELLHCVVGARDRAMVSDFYDETKALCEQRGIRFVDRKDFEKTGTPYAIAVSWRWLIEAGDATLIVLHDSLLPKYRGFAPLVNALINGEKQIGVTALFAAKGYDTGDICFQASSQVSYPIKIQEAIDLIAVNYRELVSALCEKISANQPLEGQRQNDDEATYSLWRDEDDYAIDWHQTADAIKRFVDAVGSPYKGASTFVDGRKVRVKDVEPFGDVVIENRMPGKVIFSDEGKPVVVCGEGLLKVLSLVDEKDGTSIFPLEKFRVRFQ